MLLMRFAFLRQFGNLNMLVELYAGDNVGRDYNIDGFSAVALARLAKRKQPVAIRRDKIGAFRVGLDGHAFEIIARLFFRDGESGGFEKANIELHVSVSCL